MRTPPPPATPRINGPRLFGVRPKHPVFYTIPTTGERPIVFAADGLPAGLNLDAATGRLTGSLATPGDYKLTLRASNAKGAAEKAFTIVVGEKIALTPPLGWNSYNVWASNVDQEKILRAARAMAASGLVNHGWTYVNIDEGWQGRRGGAFNAIQGDARTFPDMQGMVDEIHALGLKAGIYSSPWVVTYGGRLGSTAENPAGEPQRWGRDTPRNKRELPHDIGRYSFVKNDVDQWAAWGFDYLKYDWGPVEPPETKVMGDALRGSGRDFVYTVSNNHVKNVIRVIDELAPLTNAWRTTTDIVDNWGRVQDIGFSNEPWNAYIKPGQYTDADMLVVGWVGWGKDLHATKLTPDQQYTHITLWCLLPSPLLLGCDLERLDPFTLNLLTNDEVLAVNQDALVSPAKRVLTKDGIDVLVKPLEDGSTAVGVFNRRDRAGTCSLAWSELGFSDVRSVRDLWRQQDVANSNERLATGVAPFGAELFRVSGN